MGNLRSLAIGAAGLVAAGAVGSSANAQVVGKTICGLATQHAMATIFYDPFNPAPNGAGNNTFNLVLNRFVTTDNGAKKTQIVNFYFTQPPNGPQFVITSPAASGVTNLLYLQATPGVGGGAPALDETSPVSGAVNVNFGGAAQPDTQSISFTIQVPAGLDVSNGLISLGIVYQCKGTGGLDDEGSNVYLPNAIQFPIKVLSALQANYAGPAIDFGNVQSATAANFSTFVAPVTGPGEVDVRSSGPFDVTLTSQNNFAMNDGATGAANNIAYQLHFLGQTVSSTTAFSEVHCSRAGVAVGEQLPIQARLAQAANANTVAAYSDTLIVTITPTNEAGATQACATL